MNKPYPVRVRRQSFIQLCRSNPKEGEKYLNKIAKQLGECKKTPEVIKCLESVLFLTERTIYREL